MMAMLEIEGDDDFVFPGELQNLRAEWINTIIIIIIIVVVIIVVVIIFSWGSTPDFLLALHRS